LKKKDREGWREREREEEDRERERVTLLVRLTEEGS
jgi:hypothetical protein